MIVSLRCANVCASNFECMHRHFLTELRSVALGLMLVVASSVGSVEYIIATINALTNGEESLSPSVLGILEG